MYQKGGAKKVTFIYYVLIVLSLTTLISMRLSIKWKANIQQMSGLIISMFLGMNVGLTAGVTFAIVYQENLFIATLLGMSVGILAGSLCGICFGLLSLLEGLMAGLMGGMMGAMLGEMILVEQAIFFIKIFLLLSVCTVLLLIILSTPSKNHVMNRRWLLKPFLTSMLIGSVLFFGNSLNVEEAKSQSIPSNHEHDINTDSETDSENQNVVIEALGMRYNPKEVFVKKDLPITLRLKNSDQVEHDIAIKTSAFKLVSESSHQHEVESNMIHIHAEPQSTSEATFTISESGTYSFYCTVPGHRESGMTGILVVE